MAIFFQSIGKLSFCLTFHCMALWKEEYSD
jgi:hypothetical protein